MTHSLSGDSWCNDLGLAFAELYLFVRGAQMQQCGIAPFDHRVTQLQIPPDLYWIDHTSHFSRCCKGILDPIDYSCANKDVCPFAVTSFGVVWSNDTHFLSPLVTQTSTLSPLMEPLSSKFFSEQPHRSGQRSTARLPAFITVPEFDLIQDNLSH